jgi:thioredoxin-like negative regulator of GroEL
MAPVVHGLEQEYAGRIDFLYLNVADARNDSAKRALGFTSTPHFFFRRADGSTVKAMQGVVPEDSVRRALDVLLVDAPTPADR